jgi:hypothetical protein
MSTKELYEAHALIIKNRSVDKYAYNLVDAAIEKYIDAEQYLRLHLKAVAASKKDAEQVYRERLKSVLCKLAAQSHDAPALPDGSELQQLHFLANHHGCPHAVWPIAVAKK